MNHHSNKKATEIKTYKSPVIKLVSTGSRVNDTVVVTYGTRQVSMPPAHLWKAVSNVAINEPTSLYPLLQSPALECRLDLVTHFYPGVRKCWRARPRFRETAVSVLSEGSQRPCREATVWKDPRDKTKGSLGATATEEGKPFSAAACKGQARGSWDRDIPRQVFR